MNLMKLLLVFFLSAPVLARAEVTKYQNWPTFQRSVLLQRRHDYIKGLSYVLSGSLAIVSGFAGQSIASDALEKGTYTLFQTIGIAAVGYGAYLWTVGEPDQLMYDSLRNVRLSDRARTEILRSYAIQSKEREKRERIVKAITHGLIALLNTYTAINQPKGPVKNGLFFIGGINALAAISYSF